MNIKSARRAKPLDNRTCNACLVTIALAQTKLAPGLLWSHAIGFEERFESASNGDGDGGSWVQQRAVYRILPEFDARKS